MIKSAGADLFAELKAVSDPKVKSNSVFAQKERRPYVSICGSLQCTGHYGWGGILYGHEERVFSFI